MNYALRQVKTGFIELWAGNFKDYMSDDNDKPWLVTFCGDGGGELSTLIIRGFLINSFKWINLALSKVCQENCYIVILFC